MKVNKKTDYSTIKWYCDQFSFQQILLILGKQDFFFLLFIRLGKGKQGRLHLTWKWVCYISIKNFLVFKVVKVTTNNCLQLSTKFCNFFGIRNGFHLIAGNRKKIKTKLENKTRLNATLGMVAWPSTIKITLIINPKGDLVHIITNICYYPAKSHGLSPDTQLMQP